MSGKIIPKESFHWEIDSSSLHNKPVGGYILSPEFTTVITSEKFEKFKYKWQMKLYPKGESEKYIGHISLYLLNLNEKNVVVDFSFSLLNCNDDMINVCKEKNKLIESGWGYPEFIKKKFVLDPENKILKDGKLTIVCQVNIKTNPPKTNQVGTESLHRLQEFDRFEKVLTDPEYSDITVTCDGKTFHLHKCILASCSEVFKAMFKSDMKEKTENLVEINDIRAEVLTEFFQFVYTGKTNRIMSFAGELLGAAEKYGVKGLKTLCEEKMCSNLYENNATEYLRLAVRNNAGELKKQTLGWLSIHLEDVVKKPEFGVFGVQNPELLLDIMKEHFMFK